MKPTIKDVAKQAEVSIATVSRILNNTSKGYSQKTEKHVMETIEMMGYHPNAIARGLVNKKTQTIGVLLPELSGMVSSAILDGIEEEAHKADLSVMICNTSTEGEKTIHYLRVLEEKQVDGIIFASQFFSRRYEKIVEKMNIPVVVVSTLAENTNVPFVKVNDEQASFDATSYLVKRNHTNIGMISGGVDDPIAGMPRIEGFKRALSEHKLLFHENLIASNGGFSFEDGKEGLNTLISNNPSLTAIFAASDEIAIGVIAEAYKKGIKIPDDISIIGYDNISISGVTIPPLTTVSQPFQYLGGKAVKLLLQEIQQQYSARSEIVSHEIIERSTVKELI